MATAQELIQRIGAKISSTPAVADNFGAVYKFVLEGVPAVFLMTGFAGDGGERFRGFLDTFYHSPEDDMNLPFDWQAGAKFAQLNYLIAREIADGDEAPRWYADSFFGRTLGGGQQLAERPAAASGGATAR